MRAAAVFLACAACQPGWSAVTTTLDRACLSAWGPSANEFFVVGGGVGSGSNGLFAHFSGGKWSVGDFPSTDTMWWVFGFSSTDVYSVGENGAIFHWDGSTLTPMASPTSGSLFGIWGAAPNDLWAVGGLNPDGTGPTDVLLHYDGTSWSQVAPPQVFGVSYFKVWGTAADDVFVVGQGGVILHYDGATWAQQANPVRGPLLTVFGRSPSDVYGVGGPPATFVHYDGASWSAASGPGPASGLSGVSAANGEVFIVGLGGVKWRSAKDGWVDDSGQGPGEDLHGVWAAPDGSAIAVGGDFLSRALPGSHPKGVIAYYGTHPPPSP